MFGYLQPDLQSLTKEQRLRYRSLYCGLCAELQERHGPLGRLTLSYDMTFLVMLLGSLYEGEEAQETKRCAIHPLKRRLRTRNAATAYGADMNLILSYYKALDDWQDEKKGTAKALASKLQSALPELRSRWPRQTQAIESWIERNRALEQDPAVAIDLPVNLTGDMLAELFCPKEDEWSAELRQMGHALGRFIYFMDACEDLPGDEKKNRFNALISIKDRPDFERFCRNTLEGMLADASEAFEILPLIRDVDLLRNTLYSGVWLRYSMLQKKRSKGEI